ncbi:hypothetical protein SNOG_07776 [Parastagonospora nodorum SN15]|uniref:Uncharacterized protein n=1 Tax=Phaeosphaeria nodorum (strain SN15 / ATCC MYA-4574 / FGSC 10173) TaxID=321614 RepID=Q0UKD8_PHANO|nr:hypothetical protein SNOG_07776 [Parastagonospora nodorum SN15]EAT85242.1 hypothetical protein SNOG_07776 [Parastagonospora nodorum SN15]
MRATIACVVAGATTLITTLSLAAAGTALLILAPTASAGSSSVVPCVVGNGNKELCDSCDESKAIEVTSWNNATWVKDFNMGDAPAETGPGYKVYWKIDQPAANCRVLLFDDFNSDKGSIEPGLSGRIRLSVNKGGCYMSTIRSGGVGAGACCGAECVRIGAFPGGTTTKRSEPASKDPTSSPQLYTPRRSRRSKSQWLSRRNTGGQNKNPFANRPASSANWNAKPEGPTYTKSGKQVVDGNSFPCGSDIGCDMSVEFEASVASSVSSEKSTTYTNSEGMSFEAMAGWMLSGPTATFSVGYNKEFSEAVSSSTGNTNTDTKSKGISFRQQVTPGFQYNGKSPG